MEAVVDCGERVSGVAGVRKGKGWFSWMAGWQARKGTSSWAWIEKRGLGCFELSQSRWRAKRDAHQGVLGGGKGLYGWKVDMGR